jgi:FkbM family methyltransferase
MASRLIRNGLRSFLRHTVVAALTSSDRQFRAALYRAFARSGILLHRGGREEYIVDPRDRVIGGLIYADGDFESEKLETVFDLLRRRGGAMPEVLVDVGANIGPICIPAVIRKHVARAVAIEPDPENCRLLRVNVALNRLHDRIDVAELALSDGSGNLQLELSDSNKGDHRIRVGGEGGDRPSVQVSASTLDAICEGLSGKSLLIWIDTQGYEGFVLAGGSRTLERRTPLVLEFWPEGLDRARSFDRVRDLLAHYSGFYDLADPDTFHPMQRLDSLYESLRPGGKFTDLLVL